MKQGIIFGEIIGILVYTMLPIYSAEGQRASLLPTGNVVDDPQGISRYVSALPFSMMIFFILEVLGVGLGVAAEIYLRRPKTEK